MIEPGQIYYSLDPRIEQYYGAPRRIKIVSQRGWSSGIPCVRGVDIVTLTDDGRESRRRAIPTSELHDSPTTPDGTPRRRGYALETE